MEREEVSAKLIVRQHGRVEGQLQHLDVPRLSRTDRLEGISRMSSAGKNILEQSHNGERVLSAALTLRSHARHA